MKIIFIIVLLFSSVMAGSISERIRAISDARTKVVWARCLGECEELDVMSDRYALWGYDTYDDTIREILPGPFCYSNPQITSDGSRVVFSDYGNSRIYVVNWSGIDRRFIMDGFGLCVWKDPATGKEWVYASDTAYGSNVIRAQLDAPHIRDTIWTSTQVSIRFRVSADGTRAGGEFPWPNAGVADLENGVVIHYGTGCNGAIAPDNSYRFFHQIASHKEIYFYDKDGTNKRTISFNRLTGVDGYSTWAPRWTNDVRLITLQAPCSSPSVKSEVFLLKFNETFTDIESSVQITSDNIMDAHPNAWIAKPPQIRAIPSRLRFETYANNFSPSKTIQLAGDGRELTNVIVQHTASWINAVLIEQSGTFSIQVDIDTAKVGKGVHKAEIQCGADGFPVEKIPVALSKFDKAPWHLIIFPINPTIAPTDSIDFSASVMDYEGHKVATTVKWRSIGGSISETGRFKSNGVIGTFMVLAYTALDTSVRCSTIVTTKPHINAPFEIISPNSSTLRYAAGDTIPIQWKCNNTDIIGVAIDYSYNNGKSWSTLTKDKAVSRNDTKWGDWQWVVPLSLETNDGKIVSTISDSCRIKITNYNDPSQYAVSDTPFAIQSESSIRMQGSNVNNVPVIKKNSTFLSFFIPADESYAIALFDLTGALLHKVSGNGPANEKVIPGTYGTRLIIVQVTIGKISKKYKFIHMGKHLR